MWPFYLGVCCVRFYQSIQYVTHAMKHNHEGTPGELMVHVIYVTGDMHCNDEGMTVDDGDEMNLHCEVSIMHGRCQLE